LHPYLSLLGAGDGAPSCLSKWCEEESFASAARFHRWRRLRRRNGNHHTPRLLMLLASLGMLIAGAAVAVVITISAVYVSYTNELLPPDEVLAKQPSGGAEIYDREGRLLYKFVDDLSGLRDPVSLSEVSPYLIDATIAPRTTISPTRASA
jgi:hypothetical protein